MISYFPGPWWLWALAAAVLWLGAAITLVAGAWVLGVIQLVVAAWTTVGAIRNARAPRGLPPD